MVPEGTAHTLMMMMMMNDTKVNPLDITESTMVMNVEDERNPSTTSSSTMTIENAEASFPSPEEIRTSSTSRTNQKSMSSSSIWPGSPNSSSMTSEQADKDTGKRFNRPRCRCVLFIIVMAVLVFFIIIPAIVVNNKNQNIASDNAATDEQRPSFDDIVDFIIGNRISYEMDVYGTTTPQSQAIVWLMRDDPANIPVPTTSMNESYEAHMYMVRYVMAVNYFALGGVDWDFPLQFLMQNDVCEWNDDVHKEETIYRMGLFCADVPSDTEGGALVNLPYYFHIGTFTFVCVCEQLESE